MSQEGHESTKNKEQQLTDKQQREKKTKNFSAWDKIRENITEFGNDAFHHASILTSDSPSPSRANIPKTDLTITR
ncbi:hypothetical protein RMATCC62417_14766 [Rhizopus microsporus]|nr:hypothetical protein RMATCC62417_14766 [Rhizopus microsporus]